MPARRRSTPKNTPKYLLDRIDFQLYAATAAIKRLKRSLAPESADFDIDVPKEIKGLQYRFNTARKRLNQLASLPTSAWK